MYDIYDFNEEHPDLSNFNIQPCFHGNGKDFLIKFNRMFQTSLSLNHDYVVALNSIDLTKCQQQFASTNFFKKTAHLKASSLLTPHHSNLKINKKLS